MINLLVYAGMNLQSEVCLWTLLGLVRIIFDATLFKVNANLKQVWQMTMPAELTLPVQRVLRTMISGVMLVQCFSVYVYLASYIVLLYPVFLEERPALVLPWLLLAAIRNLLCELTSLALGLGTCVLLGPARTPCIKFVVVKIISIMPSFYMWMLLYSYYHTLKVVSIFKTFPAVLPPTEHDYGLELAIRRRRAKSLLGEEQLRKRLISNYYGDSQIICSPGLVRSKNDYSTRMDHATDTDVEDDNNIIQPSTTISSRVITDVPVWFEDLLGFEIVVPRGTDRILEQFIVMMLRISAYLTKEGTSLNSSQILQSCSVYSGLKNSRHCTPMTPDTTDTPPFVGSSSAKTASYLRDYPHIFMKKPEIPLSLGRDNNLHPSQHLDKPEERDDIMSCKWSNSLFSDSSVIGNADSLKKSSSNESTHNKSTKSNEKYVTFTENDKNELISKKEYTRKQLTVQIEAETDSISDSNDDFLSKGIQTSSRYLNLEPKLKREIQNDERIVPSNETVNGNDMEDPVTKEGPASSNSKIKKSE